MSLTRQILLSVIVVAAAIVGAASISGAARGVLARIGIDAAPLALIPGPPSEAPARPSRRAVQVITAQVAQLQTAAELRTIGTGRALRSVAVYPRDVGLVETFTLQPGVQVAEGEILAALDQDEEVIALRRAEIALEKAQTDVARYTQLAGRNAAAQVTLDDAERAYQEAELDVTAARLALEHRLVRAPIAGIPGIAEVEIGDFLRADTRIAVIDDRSKLRIDIDVPERFAARISIGQPIEARTVALPGQLFSGEIIAIDNQLDPQSRTLHLQAVIENAGDALRPGFSFSVILRFPGVAMPAVPALSVQWDAGGAYVWAVRDSKAARVPVSVVERRADQVLVRGEIAPGDVVVTEGVHNLRPGVEVADAADASAG
ncbi:MAG: efflux RND transporter periplasmic adaptor subunit [Pseudomonadota bacterium]